MNYKLFLLETVQRLFENDLDQTDMEKIQSIFDRRKKEDGHYIAQIQTSLNNYKQTIINIDRAVQSKELNVPPDVIEKIKTDHTQKIDNLEKQLQSYSSIDYNKVLNDIKQSYIVQKQYDSERDAKRRDFRITKENIIDLFVTALEGGSNHWYDIRTLPREVEYKADHQNIPVSEAIGQHILEGGYIQFHDIENPDELLGDVDINSILEAITILKKDFPEVWSNIVDEDADANDSDIFLQLCVMGKLVFS